MKSFKDDKEASVYVSTGKVSFKEKKNGNSQILTKGNGAVFQREKETFRLEEKIPSDVFTWRTEKLVFEDVPFKEALEEIEEEFGLEFDLSSSQVSDCLLNINFDNKDNVQFFEAVKVIFGVGIQKLGNKKYAVKGGSCE